VKPRATSAFPLAALYAALVTYASLFPFSGWRDRGIPLWAYVTAPWPQYWSGFDVLINVAGYVPLGLLVFLALLRSGCCPHPLAATAVSWFACSALSALMEALQTLQPGRVPSNVDWLLNSAGAAFGAWMGFGLFRAGAVVGWDRVQAHFFAARVKGLQVLMAVWPAALVYPLALPLGLGDMLEKFKAWIVELLEGSTLFDGLSFGPEPIYPLSPAGQALAVALGLLAPLLMSYVILRARRWRPLAWLLVCAVAVMATALSAALSFGPSASSAPFTPTVRAGLLMGAAAGLVLALFGRRALGVLAIVCLAVQASLLSEASHNVYYAQTVQLWEQGRFARFHGLVQWLGWVWPYLAMAHLLVFVTRPERPAE